MDEEGHQPKYTERQTLLLTALSSIGPDMREARGEDPFIFLEMVAIELNARTGREWSIKKVLKGLLPVLFAAGDTLLEEG